MTFLIPQPIKDFNRQLATFPALTWQEPREGKRVIPLEIDWDGAGTTFAFNVAARTNQPFSQIVMLDVDNAQSGADVTFWFPDTQDTLTVPAYSSGTFPVFTNATQFFASAPAAIASDITRVRVLNFRQEPIGNPQPQFHNSAVVNNIAVANGTTAIIAPAVSGTLVGYAVFAGIIAAAGNVNATVTLKDHTSGNVLESANLVCLASAAVNVPLMSVMGVAERFAGGVDVVLSSVVGAVASGFISASLKFRAP